MKVTSCPHPILPSAAVRRALQKLGADIHDARRRRRLTMAVVAERAFTSRASLQRVEAGDPGVSIGIYEAVLQALGLPEGLGDLADAGRDTVGQSLASTALPQACPAASNGRKGRPWLMSRCISI
jgi:transcriptional regulator with XRE-family HTH domain